MLLRAVVETVLLFVQCNHLEYAWEVSYWAGNCNAIELHYTYGRIPNIVADVIMLVIPIPTLWRLRLALDIKIGLIATFSLASL